ncbi:hypothetical protein D3C75_567270 [compost metagenome]
MVRLRGVAGDSRIAGVEARSALRDDVDQATDEPRRQPVHCGLAKGGAVLKRIRLDSLGVVLVADLRRRLELRKSQALSVPVDNERHRAALGLTPACFHDRVQV